MSNKGALVWYVSMIAAVCVTAAAYSWIRYGDPWATECDVCAQECGVDGK